MLDEEAVSLQIFRARRKKDQGIRQHTPVFTKGQLTERQEDRHQARHHGRCSSECPNSKTFPPRRLNRHPDPDRLQRGHAWDSTGLIKAADYIVGRCLNREFKGKAAILNISVDRASGRRVWSSSHRPEPICEMGNMTKANRSHHEGHDRSQEGRPVPRVLEGFNESVNLMASGETSSSALVSSASPKYAEWELPAPSSRSRKAYRSWASGVLSVEGGFRDEPLLGL